MQPRQNQAAQAITITVTPVTASVQVGGTLQFNSTVSNTSNSAVTWWVNGVLDGDAIHGTVSSSGMYTAPATPPVPATVSIKVVSSAASTVTATAAVTIQPQVITVVISPTSASVLAGQTKLFMATVGGDSTGVTWSVNGIVGGDSTVGMVDSLGNYAAPVITGNIAVEVIATSKKDPSKSASASVSVIASPIVVMVSPQSAVVFAGETMQFKATVSGAGPDVLWAVNGNVGGDSEVGTIDSSGNYTAPQLTTNAMATISAASKRDPTKTAISSVAVIASGIVATTANVQVAMYTVTPPAGATVSVEFGQNTTYGLTTWQQPAPIAGGPVSILVAGMRMNSTYHMRAILKLRDSSELRDVDHMFNTGSLPTGSLPNFSAAAATEFTPQSGVELVDLIGGNGPGFGAVITDLSGNIIWTYQPNISGVFVDPIKLLSNGHFLVNLSGFGVDGTNSTLQEVDLAGQVIWQMTNADLNNALSTATCTGCNVTVVGTHHDFAVLPNGHVIVIASQQKQESGLTDYPDPVTVTGDLLIDLDENHNPVWLWSSFDHLDLNRHPLAFPDWTHTNTVVYSPDDRALILSMRHQNWVLKVDYNDGKAAGDVLWKLGYQGDFRLLNGTDPEDWFYAQHDANISSSNTSGNFQMVVFDDGNQRLLDSTGATCGAVIPCESRTPILQLDDVAKTAKIEWVDKFAPAFSAWGGSARLLKNGNVESDLCGLTLPSTNTPANASTVTEVTKTSPPQIVWQMKLTGQTAYRAFRIPSLYPGVQW